MAIATLSGVLDIVRDTARIGLEYQRQVGRRAPEYKKDGSVVTAADRDIEDALCDRIGRLAPGCNFVTEERPRQYRDGAEYTFVIDPIDGSDNFSNGAPFWSISVGLLDAELRPVGGIVYAPRIDFLLFADIGAQATLNGERIERPEREDGLSGLSTILVSSRVHRQLDLRNFPGKVRGLGSAALNLGMTAAYPGVTGTVQDDRAFAWDIAGAHAALLSLGYEVAYFGGGSIDYRMMKGGNWKIAGFILAAKPGMAGELSRCVHRLS